MEQEPQADPGVPARVEDGGPTRGLNQKYRQKDHQSKPEASQREGEVSTTHRHEPGPPSRRQLGNMIIPSNPQVYNVTGGDLPTQLGMRPSRGTEAEVRTGRVQLPQGPVDKKRLSRRQTKFARR